MTEKTVSQQEILRFIERAERWMTERENATEGLNSTYSEAKGLGYDPKLLRKIVSLRKRDQNDIAEEEAMMEIYKSALGM